MTRELVSSKKQDWSTPDKPVETWIKEFSLNTDLCAEAYNARLPNFISPAQNSLGSLWRAPIRGFCNPPYENIGAWMLHALRSCAVGGFSLHLVPANPDTAWFHEFAKFAQVDFFRGRINFVDRTPPEVEIERLMLCPPTRTNAKKNAEKIAHRLILLEERGENMANFAKAIARCFEVLGSQCFREGAYKVEKQSGAGFPVMLVVFDPLVGTEPKPFRTRCAKTGELI